MSPVEKTPNNEPDNTEELENKVDSQEENFTDTTSRKRERSEEVEEEVGLPAKNREASAEGVEDSSEAKNIEQPSQVNGEETVEENKDLKDSKEETEPTKEKEDKLPTEEKNSELKETTSEDLQKEDNKPTSDDNTKPEKPDTNGEKPKSIFGSKFSGFSFGSTTSSGTSIFASTDDKPASFESLLMSGSSALDTEESKESTTANNEIGQGITPKIDLQKVEVTTGEEGEDTLYQVRAKLFVLDAETKGWKERGIGSLKLNVKQDDKKSARLIMRTEGVLKAILNVVIFADMKCEMVSDKYVRIVALEEGHKIVQYTIKVGSKNSAEELCDAIESVKSSLTGA